MFRTPLRTPISEKEVRRLNVGDRLLISGTIITMRDQAHKRALEQGKIPIKIRDQVLYHCGPLVRKKKSVLKVIAAGPTTSSRIEPFEAEFIKKFRPRIIIGKGGMGSSTSKAIKKYGVAYCDFPGGAAVLAASKIKKVLDVKWLDLGLPEAVWVFRVENFGPLIVTIDSHGKNLHEKIARNAERSKLGIYENF